MHSEVGGLDSDESGPQQPQTQGYNDLAISGQKTVPMLVGPTGGKHAMEATATLRVAEVRDNILSLGKLVKKRFSASLWVLVVARWKKTAEGCRYTWNETFCVWKLMCCNVRRDPVADELMDDVHVKDSHSSSSADPAVEPPAEVASTPALVLKTWSSIKELHARLREQGAPIYGTKEVLFRRLCEYEQMAAKKKNEVEYLEMRSNELAVATEPVTPKILPGPIQPSEVEREHHMVNHLPPAPWCELCVMGRGKDDPSSAF